MENSGGLKLSALYTVENIWMIKNMARDNSPLQMAWAFAETGREVHCMVKLVLLFLATQNLSERLIRIVLSQEYGVKEGVCNG
jgi:hypothetical protein